MAYKLNCSDYQPGFIVSSDVNKFGGFNNSIGSTDDIMIYSKAKLDNWLNLMHTHTDLSNFFEDVNICDHQS